MAPPRRDLRIEALAPHHNRHDFSCGVDSLDRYLRTQAGQDMRRKANAVFVLIEAERPDLPLGYYTLCATALSSGDIPAATQQYIPRYPLVSATLIGRLAVSEARQGQRLGAMLLADAVQRAYASAATIGSSMVVVDARNERAAAFYEGNGFVRLPDSMRLALPMRTIQRLLET